MEKVRFEEELRHVGVGGMTEVEGKEGMKATERERSKIRWSVSCLCE